MAKLEIELLPREGLPLADWARHRLLMSKSSLEETRQTVRETAFDAEAKPIWEIAAEISKRIPPEEKARMPHDGSINYKHYLYGVPKVELPKDLV